MDKTAAIFDVVIEIKAGASIFVPDGVAIVATHKYLIVSIHIYIHTLISTLKISKPVCGIDDILPTFHPLGGYCTHIYIYIPSGYLT